MTTETKKTGRPPKQRTRVVTSYPRVKINIATLMAKRQVETGKIITPADVVYESGVSKHIVARAIKDTLKEIPFDELGKLMRYFNASPDEIFKEEDDIPAE